MNPLTPEITQHLRQLIHRRKYLDRKLTKFADRPIESMPSHLANIIGMHRREVAALTWVISQYPTPPPRMRVTHALAE